MIPAVANRGTSFKGAGLYYLHDKKRDGEGSRDTSERIAWTHTRNLATDDPEFALRVMAATAMDKDRLKEAAGVKKTGRQSKGDVYAYSLAWHPDEKGKIDRAEMMKAAEQSLEALGATHHQAVIVCHQDEPHPHVHIILNMVDPANGKNLATSNDFKKLDKWANEYRKARGEEHLYTPNRAKKHEAIARKKDGQEVDFVRGQNTPRGLADQLAKAANDNTIRKDEKRRLIEAQRAADKELVVEGKAMALRHKSERHALYANYRLEKQKLFTKYKDDKKKAVAEIKAANRPVLAEIYRQQWQEKKLFARFEKTLAGRIRNMIAAMRATGETNFVKYAFNLDFRLEGMRLRHARQLEAFRAGENRSIREAARDLNTRRAVNQQRARSLLLVDRQALRERHAAENEAYRVAWKVRGERKKQAIKSLEAKGKLTKEQQIDADLLTQSEIVEAKRQFRERAYRSRGRRRTRSRGTNDEE